MGFIFGTNIDISKLRVPSDVIRYKVRLRNTNYPQIFLKYPDRIEHRWLEIDDSGNVFPGSILIGSNNKKPLNT